MCILCIQHPDQPTKPLTAYFQYVREHRKKMKAKHPDMTSVQLTKLLSQRWQALEPSKQVSPQWNGISFVSVCLVFLEQAETDKEGFLLLVEIRSFGNSIGHSQNVFKST